MTAALSHEEPPKEEEKAASEGSISPIEGEDAAASDKSSSFEIIDTNDPIASEKEEQSQTESEEEDKNDFDGLDKNLGIGSDFEHLSQYDPNDEFLQSSESFDIISSMSRKKTTAKNMMKRTNHRVRSKKMKTKLKAKCLFRQ